MQPSSRLLAAQAVAQIVEHRCRLDEAVERAAEQLGTQSDPTARSLSYGAIRGYFHYQATWRQLQSRPSALAPIVQGALAVALFEIEDAQSPEYAVVDAAVESARAGGEAKAAGLVNALLRRYLRERAATDAELRASRGAALGSPDWLVRALRVDWPADWQRILAACDVKAPMWLRVDRRRSSAARYVEQLREAGRGAEVEHMVPGAVILDTPCDTADLPGFSSGVVSVQDLAAQLAAPALSLAPGMRVLDACAAPGGKTTALLAEEPGIANLIALDANERRLARVKDNLVRCGDLRDGVIVAGANALQPANWWDGKPFDRILLDVPCSALGVIRRHPDIRLLRRESDLGTYPAVQSALLDAVWPTLAVGGRLLYTTCTVLRRENDGLVAAFLQRTPDARAMALADWWRWPSIGRDDGIGRQIFPGEARADGFYYACLSKT
jgi:16S rRNA (cytosine967-C5)-methyltransferase